MRLLLLSLCAALAACTSKQDVISAVPLLDRTYTGNYETVAACTFSGIQAADYAIQPQVQFIPVPSAGYVEVQITATSGFTGTIYAAIARFEDIDGATFQATVRAAYTGDGDVAIAALTDCTTG